MQCISKLFPISVLDFHWICWIGALDLIGWIGYSARSNPSNPITSLVQHRTDQTMWRDHDTNGAERGIRLLYQQLFLVVTTSPFGAVFHSTGNSAKGRTASGRRRTIRDVQNRRLLQDKATPSKRWKSTGGTYEYASSPEGVQYLCCSIRQVCPHVSHACADR